MKNSMTIVGISLYATCLIGNQHASWVKLTKAYYHQGALSDKVSLYFDKDPHCTQLPEKPYKKIIDDRTVITLFLPHVLIDSHEARQTINRMHETKSTLYQMRVQEVKKPIPGIKITLVFDADHIVCDYTTTDVISAHKSLIISFHNKKMLDKIRQASTPILRYASATVPSSGPKIMIDCGHGGSDDGTIGHHLIKEKDITLKVGQKLISLLKKKGFDVSVTRDEDIFVALDERTSLANRKKVDLFLSIHANSASKNFINGIETHWSPRMSLVTTKKDALGVYAQVDQLSESFAIVLQESLVERLQKKYSVCNRSVKKSIAQVLIGTDMPAALIEIGFLSHPTEAKLLNSEKYQIEVAQGICAGIEQFCQKIL